MGNSLRCLLFCLENCHDLILCNFMLHIPHWSSMDYNAESISQSSYSREEHHAQQSGFQHAGSRMVPMKKKTPQKTRYRLANLNSSKTFQETKPKHKILHTVRSKNNHSQQAQKESKLFHSFISILLLLTLVRKKSLVRKNLVQCCPAIWYILRHTYHRQKIVTPHFYFYLTTHTASWESQESRQESNSAFHSFAWKVLLLDKTLSIPNMQRHFQIRYKKGK